jgi:diadenosine tetraphosphatase ApaH/serine/threonine PP2A family protein phosphatase
MSNPPSGDLDCRAIVEQLGRGSLIGEEDVSRIFDKLNEILVREDNAVQVRSPVTICGDIHGQYEDLLELFRTAGYDPLNPDDQRFIFMGDYVDRGKYSLNTVLLLSILKIQHPDRIFLLRGNHESRAVTQQYGFHNEIMLNYGHAGLHQKCMEAFDLMPVAALTDGDVVSLHGGLSPELVFVEDILQFKRLIEIPEKGLLADLTWSDPDENGSVTWRRNIRGAGFIFGREPTLRFNHLNRLKFITRSHQVVRDGFKWYYTDNDDKLPQGPLVNVWSAPRYAGRDENIASIMRLRYDNGNPYNCPTFEDVPGPRRIPDQDITPFNYFA